MAFLVSLAILLLSVVPASADCTVHSISNEYGRTITCTTCCFGGSCATTCSR